MDAAIELSPEQFECFLLGAALFLGVIITVWDGYVNDIENYPKSRD